MLHNLMAEIARRKIKQNVIASWLGISDRALRLKITGGSRFTFPEARQLRDKFFPDQELEYLFENFQPSQQQSNDAKVKDIPKMG